LRSFARASDLETADGLAPCDGRRYRRCAAAQPHERRAERDGAVDPFADVARIAIDVVFGEAHVERDRCHGEPEIDAELLELGEVVVVGTGKVRCAEFDAVGSQFGGPIDPFELREGARLQRLREGARTTTQLHCVAAAFCGPSRNSLRRRTA